MIRNTLVMLTAAAWAALALGGCATGSYAGVGVGANPAPKLASNTASAAPARPAGRS
jgi:hypothetical protein